MNATPISELTSEKFINDLKNKAETAEDRINKHKNQFFKLLSVQLQNQDPTKPMDTTQMAAQIFALSGLEQQLESNLKLQNIADSLSNQQLAQEVNYIGKEVIYEGEELEVKDGEGKFKYILPMASEQTKIEIKNQENKTVFQGLLKKTAGEHIFELGENGINLSDGYYTFKISAYNKDYSDIPVQSITNGKIDSIIIGNQQYKYGINGKEITHGRIKMVKEGSQGI